MRSGRSSAFASRSRDHLESSLSDGFEAWLGGTIYLTEPHLLRRMVPNRMWTAFYQSFWRAFCLAVVAEEAAR
jgi:hypothetical protein